MKRLALKHSKIELEKLLGIATVNATDAGLKHLATIDKSGSMQGNSSKKAAARNNVEREGQLKIDLRGALEIHELFPEFAKVG